MALRTTRSTVSFDAPFILKGRPETFPAGCYEIETEEEIVTGQTHTAYVRVATLLYVRSTGMVRTLAIDPEALQAALARDRA